MGVGLKAIRYMQSTTEPFLLKKHKRHRKRHPNAPCPSNKTIILCREALRSNGPIDLQYFQTFKTWASKLQGEYNVNEDRPHDNTESFLLPELKTLESLLQAICEAYQEYEAQDSDDGISYSPPAATTLSSSPRDISDLHETATNPPSTPVQIAIQATQNTLQTDKFQPQSSPPPTSQTSSSLTLSPAPASSATPSGPSRNTIALLPYTFRPSKHPYDSPVYFHTLYLVNTAIVRLEKLLEELEEYFVLAEDMADVYLSWHDRLERWTSDREKREREWRGKLREGSRQV